MKRTTYLWTLLGIAGLGLGLSSIGQGAEGEWVPRAEKTSLYERSRSAVQAGFGFVPSGVHEEMRDGRKIRVIYSDEKIDIIDPFED